MTTMAAVLLLATTVVPVSLDLTGRVVDDTGNGIPSAHVYVYTAKPKLGVSSFCPSCYKDCGKHEGVDATGAFRIRALDPTLLFNVLAVADGYEPKFAGNVDPAKAAVTIRLVPRVITPERTMRGTVVDPKGKPVVGALVEPNGYHRTPTSSGYGNIPGLDKLSITNADGEFALRIPDDGATCDVRVRARNFAPFIARNIAPAKPARIQIAEGATISGRVVRDGKPVAGIVIGFVQRNRNSRSFLGTEEIATNDDGLFVMTNLGSNEDYVVYGKMQSFAPDAIGVKDVITGDDGKSADAGTFPVRRGYVIKGRFDMPALFPGHTRVVLGREPAWDVQSVEMGPDGSFEFTGVPAEEVTLSLPGPHRLKVRADHDMEVVFRHDDVYLP